MYVDTEKLQKQFLKIKKVLNKLTIVTVSSLYFLKITVFIFEKIFFAKKIVHHTFYSRNFLCSYFVSQQKVTVDCITKITIH